ncbi:MAG: hypothetical protein EAY81_11385 [Bacteroidetes bacterium]|nr:MAG: hypothetical protein EAY81_11385 [Bacteroidota bacterium]
MQIRLTKEQKIQILNSEDIWHVMKSVLARQGKIRQKQEYFWVVGLQTDSTIDFIELLNIGSLNSVQIEPRELFRIAVIKNVDRIILVHNHPSGSVKPSQADKAFTKAQRTAGELLGVEVIDHIIISPTSFFSFAENKVSF